MLGSTILTSRLCVLGFAFRASVLIALSACGGQVATAPTAESNTPEPPDASSEAEAAVTCPATQPGSGTACVFPPDTFGGCSYPADGSGCGTNVCLCKAEGPGKTGVWSCGQGLVCVDAAGD